MIIDTIDNADRNIHLYPGYAEAFAFLKRADHTALPNGRVEIQGDTLYALVGRAAGRERGAARLETHRRYADIHYIVEGVETFGWAPPEDCRRIATPYDETKDIAFYEEQPRLWFDLTPGMFVIVLAGEGHLPGISRGIVHKTVIKIRITAP